MPSEGSDEYVDPGDPLWWVPWWYRLGLVLGLLGMGVVLHV